MDSPERREAKKLALRRFRERHPDYNAQKCREWRDQNIDSARERDRQRGRLPHRKAKCREYYAANRERLNEYGREYLAAHMDDLLAYNERRKHTPEVKARKALYRAVKFGKLAKPSRCEDCQQEKTKRQLHGHHEDYGRPLDVIWLCTTCHGKRHRAD